MLGLPKSEFMYLLHVLYSQAGNDLLRLFTIWSDHFLVPHLSLKAINSDSLFGK